MSDRGHRRIGWVVVVITALCSAWFVQRLLSGCRLVNYYPPDDGLIGQTMICRPEDALLPSGQAWLAAAAVAVVLLLPPVAMAVAHRRKK